MNDTVTPSLKIVTVFPRDSEAMFNVASTRTFGGASVQMYLISKEMAGHGNVSVYSLIPNYPTIDFGDLDRFRLVKTFNESDSIFQKFRKYHSALRRIKPDFVIARGLSGFTCLLALYCRLFRMKLVYMFASDVESTGHYQRSNKKCSWFGLLVNNAALLIAQNAHQQERLKNIYGKNSEILYSGYEIGSRNDNKDGSVLWVGRCDPMKHAELFIDLAVQNPSVKFILICPPGKYQQHYAEIEKRAKSTSNLTFLNFVAFDQIERYYARASVFINTSEYEGFPQTFIQAAKNGTPIISLNANPEQFITKNACGFVTDGDMNEMNRKLNDLLNDNGLFQRQSDNAYRYAMVNHNIKTTVKKLLTLLSAHS
jgi:glycosyltransferase involved in cell wall biosynthesis